MRTATAVVTGITGRDGSHLTELLLQEGVAVRPISVVATGEAHSISDFVATAFASAGISDWQQVVINDDSLIRPADRPDMVGGATKAWDPLGWKATKSFHEIVVAMVDSDLKQELDA